MSDTSFVVEQPTTAVSPTTRKPRTLTDSGLLRRITDLERRGYLILEPGLSWWARVVRAARG